MGSPVVKGGIGVSAEPPRTERATVLGVPVHQVGCQDVTEAGHFRGKGTSARDMPEESRASRRRGPFVKARGQGAMLRPVLVRPEACLLGLL